MITITQGLAQLRACGVDLTPFGSIDAWQDSDGVVHLTGDCPNALGVLTPGRPTADEIADSLEAGDCSVCTNDLDHPWYLASAELSVRMRQFVGRLRTPRTTVGSWPEKGLGTWMQTVSNVATIAGARRLTARSSPLLSLGHVPEPVLAAAATAIDAVMPKALAALAEQHALLRSDRRGTALRRFAAAQLPAGVPGGKQAHAAGPYGMLPYTLVSRLRRQWRSDAMYGQRWQLASLHGLPDSLRSAAAAVASMASTPSTSRDEGRDRVRTATLGLISCWEADLDAATAAMRKAPAVTLVRRKVDLACADAWNRDGSARRELTLATFALAYFDCDFDPDTALAYQQVPATVADVLVAAHPDLYARLPEQADGRVDAEHAWTLHRLVSSGGQLADLTTALNVTYAVHQAA